MNFSLWLVLLASTLPDCHYSYVRFTVSIVEFTLEDEKVVRDRN